MAGQVEHEYAEGVTGTHEHSVVPHLGWLGYNPCGNSSAGLDTRYILDVTDHVWAEYYSEAMQRWVHLDPCEAAYDTPHLYEVGSSEISSATRQASQ